MRYVDAYTPAMLGLTAEEVAFLMPAAEARFNAFADKTNYNRADATNPRKLFSDHVCRFKGDFDGVMDAINGTVLYGLIYSSPDAGEQPYVITPVQVNDEGYGLKHSSYGAVSVGNPGGGESFLVGSAALSQYAKTISFNFASVYDDRDDRLDVHAEAMRLLELTLSSEQFIMMVRGDSGFRTPCGLSIRDGMRNDCPPSTSFDKHDSKDFKAEIDALTQPLSDVLDKLREKVGQAVSKKSEYAVLVELAKEACAEYARIAPAILEIGNAKGAQEGQRAHHQFVSEMNERLGQLNIGQSISQLMGLGKD
jgi:hypothetical protein